MVLIEVDNVEEVGPFSIKKRLCNMDDWLPVKEIDKDKVRWL